MSRLMAYSSLLDVTTEIGPPSENLDKILELGEFMAEGRPGLIVYVEGPVLQKWEDGNG